MLKKVPELISPELLKILSEMGHGQEIVIADGNYPSVTHGEITGRLVRCDGLGGSELLEAILELFPLDKSVEASIAYMEVSEGDTYNPVIWKEYQTILEKSGEENINIEYMGRFDFYERAKGAYAIIATSEKALYSNVILKKGVIE